MNDGLQAMSLLEIWLRHYDPVHRGWTPAGIANGVCTTNGFSFPRIRGGYNLRRSAAGSDAAGVQPVGAAGCEATAIRTFPWIRHGAGARFIYQLTAIGGGGAEGLSEPVTASVDFDDAGEWIGPRPSCPADMRVERAAGGRFLLKWTHAEDPNRAVPAEFGVFNDAGSGVLDYSGVPALVAFRSGRIHYAYLSPPFPQGMRVRWAVRAMAASGVDDGNDRVLSATALAVPPPAPAAARAIRVADSPV